MAEMTSLPRQSPAGHAAGELGVATAEMPGLHALERPPPPLPMGPGRVERRAVASLRHGPHPFMAHDDGARDQGSTPLLAFIEYLHTTMAQPFQWTYGRQPLSV